MKIQRVVLRCSTNMKNQIISMLKKKDILRVKLKIKEQETALNGTTLSPGPNEMIISVIIF